jgi:hypothetical protein
MLEVLMSGTWSELRKSGSDRRIGYLIAAVLDAVLLYLINGRPGWAALPFLTGDTTEVVTLLNISLVVGVVVNLLQVGYDPRWLVAAGALATTGIGLVVLIRLWQVFPFDFGSSSVWPTFARVLLVLAIVGSVAGLVVNSVTLAGAASRDHGPLSRHA